jgi:hypothetical protein
VFYLFLMEWVFHLFQFSYMKLSNSCIMRNAKIPYLLELEHAVSILTLSFFLHCLFEWNVEQNVGGLGIEGGTVVVSTEGVDGKLRNSHEMVNFLIFLCNLCILCKLVCSTINFRRCSERLFNDRPN